MAAAGFTYAFVPHVCNLEDELPDHDQLKKLETQP